MTNNAFINKLFSIVNLNCNYNDRNSGITNDEIVIKLSDMMGIEDISVPKKRNNIIKSLIAFLKKASSTFRDFTNQNLDFEDLICELIEKEEMLISSIEQAEWFQYLDGGYESGLEDNASFACLLEKAYEEQGLEHITIIRKFEYNYAKSIEKYEQVIQ